MSKGFEISRTAIVKISESHSAHIDVRYMQPDHAHINEPRPLAWPNTRSTWNALEVDGKMYLCLFSKLNNGKDNIYQIETNYFCNYPGIMINYDSPRELDYYPLERLKRGMIKEFKKVIKEIIKDGTIKENPYANTNDVSNVCD